MAQTHSIYIIASIREGNKNASEKAMQNKKPTINLCGVVA